MRGCSGEAATARKVAPNGERERATDLYYHLLRTVGSWRTGSAILSLCCNRHLTQALGFHFAFDNSCLVPAETEINPLDISRRRRRPGRAQTY